MFKGNLSSRPFYNERLVSLLLVLGAVGTLALTAFNVVTIQDLNAERTEHRGEIEQFEAAAQAADAAANAAQLAVDRPALLALAAGTHEANALIDERTFSWTVFFDLVEDTIPMDVRLLAVSPRVEKGVFTIVMLLQAKQQGDIEVFIDRLEETGSFYDLLPADQQRNDDGTFTSTLSSSYLAPVRTAAKANGGSRP